MGRPSEYTEDRAEAICEALADGKSLVQVCDQEGMPSRETVRRWLKADLHGFRAKYAHAREQQAVALADEILQIADDGTNDTQTDEEGRVIVNHDHINRSRLRVDARKWLASKLLPKVYGSIQPASGDSEENRDVKIHGGLPDA